MKTLQSSSRGHGGRGGGGRGGGRGMSRGGGRGGGGGGSRDDKRFASRFTDPRFQLSQRVHQKQQRRPTPQEQMTRAAQSDPRFAKHLRQAATEEDEEESEGHEENEEDEEMMHSGEEGSSDASSQDGGDEEAEHEEEEENDEDDDDEVAAWAPDNVEYTESTRRVAVVNCDWDHVRAVDLYAILFNALPLGGQLKDVCVYMSDFGKRMIEHERHHGPDLWAQPGEELPEDVAAAEAVPMVEELDDGEPEDDGWQDDDPAMLQEQGEDGEYFSGGKFRKYEMDRMKYYYAVATFDSPETAAAVYNELDGMDIEASGVTLDLRYIDDDETFEDPVSRADSIPPRFKPLSSFSSAALSNTRFRISWDQEDVFRHQSVQDSFTGTTEEDDLAAYLAPPDSDDDDDVRDTRTGRTKAEEKARIRRRYAALLGEIGGLPEDGEEKADEYADGEGGDLSGSSSDSGSDDDSLNRFSDVEMDSDADDEEDEEDEEGEFDGEDEDGEVMGDMEGTLDLDVDTKAAHLQRDARRKQKLKGGDLAAKAEVKYKQRRKEMKKAKKEMALQEREAEREALAASKDEEKRKLKALLGTDDNGAVHLSGKARRKQHAQQVKQRLAEERASRKQMRAASRLGVTRNAKDARDAMEAEHALDSIDTRFQSKLISDPRFHLEVATKDKRVSDDVQELAATVAKARRGKRASEVSSAVTTGATSNGRSNEKKSTGGKHHHHDNDDVDDAVGYFLNEPANKKVRRF